MKSRIIIILVFIFILSMVFYYTSKCLNNMYVPSSYCIESGEIVKR